MNSIKKKQAASPPAKVTVRQAYQSLKTAPQEVLVSDTSIRNELIDDDHNNNRPNKFYSPQYRAEVANSAWQKSKSPTAYGKNNIKTSIESNTARARTISSAQQQALLQLQKIKQNAAYKTNTERQPTPPPNFKVELQRVQPPDRNYRPNHLQADLAQPQQQEQFEYVFPNGDHYNGTWNGKWIEGSGVYDYTKQNLQYRGQFKRSKPHGRGTLLRKPTSNSQREDLIYEGEWMNGMKEGNGKYHYFKDTTYEGGWVKNRKEGYGTFVSAEGQYQGEWQNDKRHGTGILKLNNGHQFEGSWEEDQFISGTVAYSNGDRYEGDLQQNSRHGYGTYNYTNNHTQYRGGGKTRKHGTGSIEYYNGDSYDGGMHRDKREGMQCSYEWANGDRVKGQFKNDMPVSGKIFIKGDGQYEFDLTK